MKRESVLNRDIANVQSLSVVNVAPLTNDPVVLELVQVSLYPLHLNTTTAIIPPKKKIQRRKDFIKFFVILFLVNVFFWPPPIFHSSPHKRKLSSFLVVGYDTDSEKVAPKWWEKKGETAKKTDEGFTPRWSFMTSLPIRALCIAFYYDSPFLFFFPFEQGGGCLFF